MDKIEYEERIRELENKFKVMQERYNILVETTSAILFEYRPAVDTMIFTYNFPDRKDRRVIENYHEYMKKTPLVHPDHMQQFMEALTRASYMPVRGEVEYLSKVSGGEFQWHRTYYSSIADQENRIISVLGRIHNVHESASERQQMMHRIATDFLTGLYNKGAAVEKIGKWLKENPTREAHLIMVDLDNFKEINDIYGHPFGDEVLMETAAILQKCFSERTLISRFGGDEFVLLVEEESVRSAECRVDQMMQKLSQEVLGMEKPLSCSVGIAARVSKYENLDDLLNRADQAMYQAKKNGKNCYYVDYGN